MTIQQYLKSQYLNRRIFSVRGRAPSTSIAFFKSLPEEKRHEFDLVIGHGAHRIRAYAHPDILKTTILRDPVDRIISHYYFAMRAPNHALHHEAANLKMPLADYVRSGLHGSLRNNYVTRFLQISAEEAEKNPEESVARAYQLLKKEYAIVGLLENLAPTLDRFAGISGFHNIYNPPLRNVARDRPKISEIDDSTIAAIREVNFLDVQLYQLIRNDADMNSSESVR